VKPSWKYLERDRVRLACADYGGEGPVAMLLHGLAGHAEEWSQTASWLTGSHHVVAPDARGHGRSTRFPTDVSRTAHVADAEAWLEEVGPPALLVGQSLGGHTALLVAAHRPDLVSSLVVAEASPERDPNAPAEIRGWLDSWPAPFPSRETALAFFGGDTPWSRAWVDGLERSEDGLRARFDTDVMVRSLDEVAKRDYWAEWSGVACPTLVVRAQGGVSQTLAKRMVDANTHATLVVVEDARHDVHLEQPARWRELLEPFAAAG
jgi:pimeloyl-ACP methyl ester carboxylesterase